MATCPAPDSGSVTVAGVGAGASALAFFFLALLDSEWANELDKEVVDMTGLRLRSEELPCGR